MRVGDIGQGSRDQHHPEALSRREEGEREGGQVLLGYWDFDVDINGSLNTHG